MTTKDDIKIIKEFVSLLLTERRLREIEIASGSFVPEGSDAHIADLQEKIAMLEKMKKRHQPGSSARADHARVVQRLKRELKQAHKISQRLNEKDFLDEK